MADFKKLKDGQGNSYNVKDETARTNLASHTGNTSNPHSVTKAQVGLGNVDNTSDANKPISNAQATVNATIFDKANVDTIIPETPVDTHVPSTKLVNDKFVKHNTYDGTLSVKKADEADVATNLKAYSDDSGTLQENPFISQETGTNNNVEIVTTGNVCEIKSKNGNTISYNQLVNHTTFVKTLRGITCTYDSSTGILRFTGSGDGQSGSIQFYSNDIPIVSGSKYLFNLQDINNSGIAYNNNAGAGDNVPWIFFHFSASGFPTAGTSINGYRVLTGTETSSNEAFRFTFSSNCSNIDFSYHIILSNITQWFNGNDNIPADLLAHPEHFSWQYNGSLAFGSNLVNANGRYLECGQGRQLWDEETVIQNNVLTSKNFIRVNPNATLYFRATQGNYGNYVNIYAYDEEQNYIGQITGSSIAINSTFVIPSNARYIKFATTSGTTYNNDITISLYYTPEQGGEGYDKYYPYVAPKVIDTGSEVLRSAGSVKDIKTPVGTITRKVGNYTFTGNEDWNYYEAGTNSFFYVPIPSGVSYKDSGKSLVSNGIILNLNYLNIRVYLYRNPQITNSTNMKTVFANGVVMNYELATPTTEQGTPFSAYPDINDYSYMLWCDTDNNLVSVPQGASIFYPVNYAGTLDDLVAYVEGDVTNLAKKEDLTDFLTQVDLSSGITNSANLTITTLKLFKTGNVINLSLKANKDSDISANTSLIYSPNLAPVSPVVIPAYIGSNLARFVISNDGNVYCESAIPSGTTIHLYVSYTIA